MNSNSQISHDGIIQSVENDSVTVLLSPGVSCSGCQAEKSCGMSMNSAKVVKISGSFKFNPGDKVDVLMKISQGYLALFFGYILPLLLVVISLVTLNTIHADELISGVISIGVLIPYYIVLWFCRNYFGRKFSYILKAAV
jgi:sigma-E factor negative regulatory protein RseC